MPAHDRRDDLPLGPGVPVHLRAALPASGRYEIIASTGRTGVRWDNAWAESFNATLKNERVHRMVYPTRRKAINDIASWIELIYNQTRLHSALGYRTQGEAEHDFVSSNKAA